jgi:hypothetical protein
MADGEERRRRCSGELDGTRRGTETDRIGAGSNREASKKLPGSLASTTQRRGRTSPVARASSGGEGELGRRRDTRARVGCGLERKVAARAAGAGLRGG